MPSLKYSPYLALAPPVGISILPAMAWLAMNVQIEQQLLTGCKIQRKYHSDEKSGIEFWSLAAGGGWLCRLWRAEAVEHGGESGIKEIEEI